MRRHLHFQYGNRHIPTFWVLVKRAYCGKTQGSARLNPPLGAGTEVPFSFHERESRTELRQKKNVQRPGNPNDKEDNIASSDNVTTPAVQASFVCVAARSRFFLSRVPQRCFFIFYFGLLAWSDVPFIGTRERSQGMASRWG